MNIGVSGDNAVEIAKAISDTTGAVLINEVWGDEGGRDFDINYYVESIHTALQRHHVEWKEGDNYVTAPTSWDSLCAHAEKASRRGFSSPEEAGLNDIITSFYAILVTDIAKYDRLFLSDGREGSRVQNIFDNLGVDYTLLRGNMEEKISKVKQELSEAANE